MKKFEEIDSKEFANGIVERNFVADVNFTVAAMANLSRNTEKVLSKDDVVKHANALQEASIGMQSYPKAYDDIFSELAEEGFVVNNNIDTQRLVDLRRKDTLSIAEKEELKEVETSIEKQLQNQEIGFNDIRLSDIAVNSIKIKYSDVKF